MRSLLRLRHVLRLRRRQTLWDALMNEPGFSERMERAKADMAAGRWYAMKRTESGHEFIPNPDWPADGEPPTGAALEAREQKP